MNIDSTILGIDIGTTKAAAVLIGADKELLAVCSRPHGADLRSAPGYAEQDVDVLLETVHTVILELPERLRAEIKAVGVTGQMHGVTVLDKQLQPLTAFVTWQDGRCLEGDFLKQLEASSGYKLSPGFGCATLAWLTARGKLPSTAESACTVQDLFTAGLCGMERPVADPTDAASWGLFDLHKLDWDYYAIEAAGVSSKLIPDVVPCAGEVGRISSSSAERFGIPAGSPVAAAIGDNQASLLATLKDPEQDLALTLGTGGQLSAVLPAAHTLTQLPLNSKWEYRPFPGGRFFVAACSLSGGSAWKWLIDTVQCFLKELDIPSPPEEKLYELLNELGFNATNALEVCPHFLGERYDTSLRGSIGGIDLHNLNLGAVSRGLALGIIENLKNMMPDFALSDRTRIVGSGNALRRNPLLRQTAEEVFGLPLTICVSEEEAACGAAVNASGLIC